MSTGKLSLGSPLAVLGLAIVAFGAWIAYDAAKPARTTDVFAENAEPAARPHEEGLMRIHIGQPREHVEQALSGKRPLIAEQRSDSAGNATTSYTTRVQLRHPVPHLMAGGPPIGFTPGIYNLTLEFDAEEPGEPLVRAELTYVGSP